MTTTVPLSHQSEPIKTSDSKLCRDGAFKGQKQLVSHVFGRVQRCFLAVAHTGRLQTVHFEESHVESNHFGPNA